MGSRLESNAANMAIRNQIHIAGIILDHENSFPQKNMVRGRNRVGHILRNINAERLKWDRMQKLVNLFSHPGKPTKAKGKNQML